ncbi:hypothetical protein [Streptomyces sp. NPDC000851]
MITGQDCRAPFGQRRAAGQGVDGIGFEQRQRLLVRPVSVFTYVEGVAEADGERPRAGRRSLAEGPRASTAEQRKMFIDTLAAYEAALAEE